MATKAEIAEQVQAERDQIKLGLKRLERTPKLEEKTMRVRPSTVCLHRSLLPLLTERLKDTRERIYTGTNGPLFAEIAHYLAEVEPEVAAAIACKLTFDKVFGAQEDSNAVINVSEGIGNALEAECQMSHYEKVAPGLLKVLKDNYWHRSIGTQQKVTVIQTLMNRHDVTPWKPWGTDHTHQAGWLVA